MELWDHAGTWRVKEANGTAKQLSTQEGVDDIILDLSKQCLYALRHYSPYNKQLGGTDDIALDDLKLTSWAALTLEVERLENLDRATWEWEKEKALE